MYDYNLQCDGRKIPKITFPARDYVIQVARFDPAKGIPDLVRSYGILRQRYMKDIPSDKAPQLVM